MKFTDNDKDGIRQRKIQQSATKNTAFINEHTFFSLPVRIFAETSNCFKGKEKNQKKGFTRI